jgi:hypothetical protein
MRVATDIGGGYPYAVVQWQYTDPVTGSKGASGILRDNSGTTELSTLGGDVTYPPPPPDPQTYQPPIYIDPVKQTYYEIEGGPTASYGVDSWYTNMVNKDFDRHMAEVYWRHGFRDWAMAIVANNPNVGVLSRHYDRNGNFTGIGLRWGAQAAGFLMGINRDIESGRLVEEDSAQYGEVVGYQLDSPQNSRQGVVASDRKEGVCSIELVIYGPKSADNNLVFPSGNQRLGSVEGSSQGTYGWRWQVEFRGTVAGDVSKWFLGQRVSERDSGTIVGNTGISSTVNVVTRDQPDNPHAQYRQQPSGQSNFFFIDAPGPLRSPAFERSTTTVQNFFTYVERGKNRCGIKWSLTTEVQNNRLVRQVLRPGHF